MINSIIIDASVVAKWLLTDEEDTGSILLKKEFTEKNVFICIPDLIFYEVNNFLKSAVSSGRITANLAKAMYGEFLNLHFIVYSSKELFINTLKKALELNISSYDASYISLAEYLEIPFYTADTKLIKKAGKNPLIKNLKDYKV